MVPLTSVPMFMLCLLQIPKGVRKKLYFFIDLGSFRRWTATKGKYGLTKWSVIIIERAKEDGQVGGLIPHLVEDGISMLQYADDTILFCFGTSPPKDVNMKLILCSFEELSGLKIYFHKSEFFCFGKANDEVD
jgi:hypothetical protein